MGCGAGLDEVAKGEITALTEGLTPTVQGVTQFDTELSRLIEINSKSLNKYTFLCAHKKIHFNSAHIFRGKKIPHHIILSLTNLNLSWKGVILNIGIRHGTSSLCQQLQLFKGAIWELGPVKMKKKKNPGAFRCSAYK